MELICKIRKRLLFHMSMKLKQPIDELYPHTRRRKLSFQICTPESTSPRHDFLLLRPLLAQDQAMPARNRTTARSPIPQLNTSNQDR